jgi:arylsulfatase A-like enzyme
MQVKKELKISDIYNVNSEDIRQRVFVCAVHGAMAWMAYGVIECSFLMIIPWIIKPAYNYYPFHWGFTALLFIIYTVSGFILGGLLGLGFGMAARRIQFFNRIKSALLSQLLGTSAIVLALTAYYIYMWSMSPLFSHLLAPLIVSSILMLALMVSFLSDVWLRRLYFLTNPWTSCILVLGVPWTTREMLMHRSSLEQIIASFIYVVVVGLISFYVKKIIERPGSADYGKSVLMPTVQSIVFLVLLSVAVLGISFFLKQTPRTDFSHFRSIPPGVGRPNVVLITMDTVRADHTSLYGYERDTTQYLKKLAAEATLYTNSMASGDMTLSTHASIFTGMYALRHRAHFDPWNNLRAGRPLDSRFKTLAEALSEKGYFTMGIVSNNSFLSPAYQLDQGFRYYDSRGRVPFLGFSRAYYLRQFIRDVMIRFASRESSDLVCRRAEDINKEVFGMLDKVKEKNESFFLFVNYMDAHEPYIPPPPFDTLFPGKDETFTTHRYFTIATEMIKSHDNLKEKDLNHLISQYDGAISYEDLYISNLISRLKEMGLYENSLIIITSDHGEAFGSRNLIGHGVSVYQDQVRVPLIIKYPNINEGRVVDEIADSVDLMPTILDVLGYGIPEDTQGRSLIKITREARAVLSESYPSGNILDIDKRFDRVERAIFLRPYKFISSTAGKKELYNIQNDPQEMEDLYQSAHNVAGELDARLGNWIKGAVTEDPSQFKLDSDTMDRLKALGYVK